LGRRYFSKELNFIVILIAFFSSLSGCRVCIAINHVDKLLSEPEWKRQNDDTEMKINMFAE